jgi:hypothetical protein
MLSGLDLFYSFKWYRYSLVSIIILLLCCRVLKEGKSYEDLTEVAKLFNIHAKE